MQFDKTTGRWAVLGAADQVRASDTEKTIVEALTLTTTGYTPKEVSELAGINYESTKKALQRMAVKGRVKKTENGGRYVAG